MAIPQYKPQRDYTRQVQPQEQQPTIPAKQPSQRSRRHWTKGERFLSLGMVAVVAVIAVVSLNFQSSISQTSVEMDKLNDKIKLVQKENEDLTNEVAEKSTYERFVKKAQELGLTTNADNIKAVSKE